MRWFAFAILAAIAPAQPVPQLTFEVASVKPGGDAFSTRPELSRGRIRWTTQLCYLIGYANRLDASRVSGKMCGSVYSLEATFDPAATDDQVRAMLRALLADRFQMRAHRVSTEADGFALVVARGGLRIKETMPASEPPAMPDWVKGASPALKTQSYISATHLAPGVAGVTGRNVSMSQLAETLGRTTGMPVWDRTGLSGNYYFGFRYALDPGDADLASEFPALASALQESLGLRLEKQKGMAETLVIDSIEKPAEN